VWYEGNDTSDRRFLSADERGSIIAVTDSGGALLGINKYDEYGVPQSTNLGRFGYTGQAWLPEVSLWYYKARMYRPDIGRFLQTDPIGYEAGPNLYAYVGNDPINWTDPLGLTRLPNSDGGACPTIGNEIVCTHTRGGLTGNAASATSGRGLGGFGGGGRRRGNTSNDVRNQCSIRQPDGSTPSSNARLVRRGFNLVRDLARVSPGTSAVAYGALVGSWIAAVLPNSVWDYKRHGGTDTMGNVNYGATGSALGIPLNVLLRAAGLVQPRDPQNEGQPYDLSTKSSYGDQPRDQRDIRRGAQC